MKIEESSTSRKSQFAALLRRHAPDLTFVDDHLGYVVYFSNPKRQGFAVSVEATGREVNASFMALFDRGRWESVCLSVRDGSYFDAICRFAQEYEAMSQKETLVVKEF